MPDGSQVVAGLVAFSLCKKVAVYGLARYYGFPRIYRKFLRLHQSLRPTQAEQETVRRTTKSIFRLPNRLSDSFRAFKQRNVQQSDGSQMASRKN